MSLRHLIALFAAAATLTATTAFARGKSARLVLSIAPASTEVYVDGQKRGTGESVKELKLAPGPHLLRLVHDGDEHEDQVVLESGVQTRFEWAFEDDKPANDGSYDFIEQATAAALQ